MQITTDGSTLTLDGRFDAHVADDFRTAVEACAPQGDIDVDLASVDFIDSTALAELVRAMKHCRERGADLILTSLSNPVRVILELTRLDQALTIR